MRSQEQTSSRESPYPSILVFAPGTLWNEPSELGQDRKVASLKIKVYAIGASPVHFCSIIKEKYDIILIQDLL